MGSPFLFRSFPSPSFSFVIYSLPFSFLFRSFPFCFLSFGRFSFLSFLFLSLPFLFLSFCFLSVPFRCVPFLAFRSSLARSVVIGSALSMTLFKRTKTADTTKKQDMQIQHIVDDFLGFKWTIKKPPIPGRLSTKTIAAFFPRGVPKYEIQQWRQARSRPG